MVFVHYEELKVYKRAYALVVEVHVACRELPKHEQNGSGLAGQMRRASRSICANMAEGLSKVSTAQEEKRFLSMARGSCEEMRVWARMGYDFEYWNREQADRWRQEYEEVSKIIFALMEKRKAA
jgi:four helix bundle protein